MTRSPVTQPLLAQRCGGLRRYGGGPESLTRLVCFPWAGGGASAFRRFAPYLPETVELLAAQYPGREDRFAEEPWVRMEQIVQHVLDDLVRLPDRPLMFLGHSMGALVAYEVAHALAARFGRQPQLLIVSGSGAPDTRAVGGTLSSDASDREFIADIGRMGGTPREILEDAQLMRALLPALRADYEVLDHYVGRRTTPLSCALVVCAGDADPTVSRPTLEAWCGYTTASCRLRWFVGNHFYLQADPGGFVRSLHTWIAPQYLAFCNAEARSRRC